MNKKLIKLGIFLILIFIFAGCSKKQSNTLVIYSPHGKELLSEFEKRFEAANPGVDVQWLDMGSQEIIDRIKTEKDNPQADIWWGAPSTLFIKAEGLGLLEKYTPTWSANIEASHKSKNDFWFGTFLTPEVIAYNNKFVDSTSAPKTWEELVSADRKGMVVLRNPMASGTLRMIFSAMIYKSVKETGNDVKGFNWLKALDDNTSSYAADPTQMYLKLASDGKNLTLWNMPDIVLQQKNYSYPFGYVFPSGGTVVVTDGIAIVKNSKNVELAKKFYEFVTTQESMYAQAEKFYRVPSRNDLDKNKLPDWLKNANYTEMPLDWEAITANESEWMKKWDSVIKTNK